MSVVKNGRGRFMNTYTISYIEDIVRSRGAGTFVNVTKNL